MRQSPKDRFEAKIEKQENGCWLWKGAGWNQPNARYGFFHMPDKVVNAHKAAWLLYRGPVPEGLCVLHKCDRPFCVNPDHLELGTRKKNYWDAVDRNPTFQGLPKELAMSRGTFDP